MEAISACWGAFHVVRVLLAMVHPPQGVFEPLVPLVAGGAAMLMGLGLLKIGRGLRPADRAGSDQLSPVALGHRIRRSLAGFFAGVYSGIGCHAQTSCTFLYQYLHCVACHFMQAAARPGGARSAAIYFR